MQNQKARDLVDGMKKALAGTPAHLRAAHFGHRAVMAHLVAAGAYTAYVNMHELPPREITLGGARGEHADNAPDGLDAQNDKSALLARTQR